MSEAPIPSVIEISTKVFALGATTSLLASLVYDWGFFSALSLSFLEIPSSLSDHVRSTLLWFPKVFASFGGLFVFELLTRRIEKGMTEDEIVRSSPNPECMRRFRAGPSLRLITCISFSVVAVCILAGSVLLHALPFALCGIWLRFSVWAQSAPLIRARRPVAVRLAVHFVPLVIIFLYFSGYTEAVRLYERPAQPAKLTNASSTSETITLLRLLDKGVLVKEASGVIAFRPWSEIKHLETPGKYTPVQGILCVWFHVGCLPPQKKVP